MEKSSKPSLREFVGSDEIWALVLAFLGPVGEDREVMDGRTLAEALALARVVPGVSVASLFRVGPLGAKLLETGAPCFGGLRLVQGSSWAHVMAALKVNSGLRTLDLSYCKLAPQDVALLAEALAANVSLEELNLSHNRLGEAGGRGLAVLLGANTTLRVLGLEYTFPESDNGDSGVAVVPALANNTGVRVLSLCRNHLGKVGVRGVAAILRSNTTLRELDLSHDYSDSRNGLSQEVFAALEGNIGLHTLSLRDCNLRAAHGKMLAHALRNRRSGVLRKLDLGGNKSLHGGHTNHGLDGCSAIIVASLQTGSALCNLSLGDTGMGLAAAHLLAQYLRLNHTLEVLDLSEKGPGEDAYYRNRNRAGRVAGGESIWLRVIEALATNTGLRSLKLFNCGLKMRDAEALAASFQTNHVLRNVDLGRNDLEHKAGCVLAAGLATNSTLWVLDLRRNSLVEDTLLDFVKLLQTNTTLRWLLLGPDHFPTYNPNRDTLKQAGRATGCSILIW